jgi:hypothetical protein
LWIKDIAPEGKLFKNYDDSTGKAAIWHYWGQPHVEQGD